MRILSLPGKGMQMLTTKDKDGKTVYLLAFSPRGVGDYNYNVKFAYSHNPLTGFVKAKTEERSMILGVDERNTFMSNLGHVQFLHVDGQDWIVHWEFPAPFGGYDTGRIYALSQMTWQYNEALGFDTPVANGPTTSLQPLPSVFSGYRNVADRATVTATGEIDGSAKYLTDGMTVTMRRDEKMQFRAKNNKTKITLTFAEPDEEVFRCLKIAKQCAAIGNVYCAAMNGANEEAVAAFLRDEIGICAIPDLIEAALDKTETVYQPQLSDILEADRLAREAVREKLN